MRLKFWQNVHIFRKKSVDQFGATYCPTPPAASLRSFLALVMALNLTLAQSDVTKAFTLNPIDVDDLYVEQMPGTEVAGDWAGATKANTVCLLHKCLEGLDSLEILQLTSAIEPMLLLKPGRGRI